jgi:hypothetical protein
VSESLKPRATRGARYAERAFWLGLIAVAFVNAQSAANPDISAERAAMAIAGPMLLIAVGAVLFEWIRRIQPPDKAGHRASRPILLGLIVLTSLGLVLLSRLVTGWLDRNLGSRHPGNDTEGPWLFDIDSGCALRLVFVILCLLLFVAAGRSVSALARLSYRRFQASRPFLGAALALATLLAVPGLAFLGWVIVTAAGFALFFRQ